MGIPTLLYRTASPPNRDDNGKRANGAILYRGPSELDGSPIVVVATGFLDSSSNEKTGAMIQTWIMRSDLDPVEAIDQGKDESICGDCPHRQNTIGSCYVAVSRAPLAVYRGVSRGIYPDLSGDTVAIKALGCNRIVRIGSYGDPAAVPFGVWDSFTARAIRWTGYTHQWRICDDRFRMLIMASVDSPMESGQAQRAGWRTFRVRVESESVLPGEVVCPASEEAGKRVTCSDCSLCMGGAREAKSIVILSHGGFGRARRFQRAKANGWRPTGSLLSMAGKP